jgi:hypothetical protein
MTFLTFFKAAHPPEMANPLDEFSDAPLTGLENQKARKIIRDQERMDWLWASGRIWAGYIAGMIAGVWAGWEHIRTFFKWLVS